MDVLSKGTSLLGIVFTSQSDEVILYLEGSSKRDSVFDNGLSLFFSEVENDSHKSGT